MASFTQLCLPKTNPFSACVVIRPQGSTWRSWTGDLDPTWEPVEAAPLKLRRQASLSPGDPKPLMLHKFESRLWNSQNVTTKQKARGVALSPPPPLCSRAELA